MSALRAMNWLPPLLGAIAFLIVAGCSSDAPKIDSKTESKAVAEIPMPKPFEAAQTTRPAALINVHKVAYEPPFPQRTNLFEPPRRARNNLNRSGEESNSVVLMGFAKLDTQRVVLSIDGVVTPLEDGAESAGVRVISIAPPQAVLQRGRSRWTASIE